MDALWTMLSDELYENLLQRAARDKRSHAAKETDKAGEKGGLLAPPASSWSSVPYGDPTHLQGLASPYYTAAHDAWRRKCRAFVDTHLTPHVAQWDESGAIPDGLRRRMYEAGMLAVIWPTAHGGTPPPL